MKTASDKIEWHPYPEERPEEEDFYLLTIKGPRDAEPWIDDEYSYDPEDNGVFYEYGYERYDDVIAWARYPVPYKGDGSSTDELWTPCSDELPEKGASCLVTCEDKRHRYVKEDTFVDEDMLFETDLLGWGKIVAWMYYPAPYERQRMTDWHAYPEDKPSERDKYFITVNFGDQKNYTDSTTYDPEIDEFLGYENRDWVKAWTGYPKAYGEGGTEKWNVYPDNLPNEDTACFITCEDIRNRKRFVCENVFCGGFGVECLNHYRVLAWMYIPQPYMSDTSHMKVLI